MINQLTLLKVSTPVSPVLLIFMFCLSMAGCQQTQIDFTQTQAPKLAFIDDEPSSSHKIDSNKGTETNEKQANIELNTLPKVRLQLPTTTAQIDVLNLTTLDGVPFQLHLFPKDKTGLSKLSLVAVSPKKPFTNINLLAATLQEMSIHIAGSSELSCIDSLKNSIRMHTINTEVSCDEDIDILKGGAPLVKFWQASMSQSIDTDKISRSVKLSKHISAFSGSEIETLWRKVILGENHVYNQSLDQSSLVDELSSSEQQGDKIANLLNKTLNQSQWHLFVTHTSSLASLKEQAIELMSQLLDPSHILDFETKAEQISTLSGETKPHQQESTTAPNTDKIIFLIDAPDTVQTQVRLGYRINVQEEPEVNPLAQEAACTGLAALLGRSYTGRLFYDLREQRGLTYGIYAHCIKAPLSTTFKVRGSTQIQHTGAFIAGILDHVHLLKERATIRKELDSVNTYLIGQEILANNTSSHTRARHIQQNIHFRNGPNKAEVLAKLATITPQELQKLSQFLFNTPPYIVLRGDAKKIIPDLKEKFPSWTIKLAEAH